MTAGQLVTVDLDASTREADARAQYQKIVDDEGRRSRRDRHQQRFAGVRSTMLLGKKNSILLLGGKRRI